MKKPSKLRAYFGFSRRQMNGFWLLALLSQALLAWTFYVHPTSNYTLAQQQADLVLLDSMKNDWRKASFQPTNYIAEKPQKVPVNRGKSKKYKEYPPKKNYVKPPIQPFDIAAADTTQLKQIRGIGSKLSQRIILFRDKLGGFYSLNQLKEVYGLSEEVQEALLKVVFLENPRIKKLSINIATEEELGKHPYISYKLAKVLVNYRQQHGPYRQADDLRAIRMLKEDELVKLLPYIEFDIQ